MIFRFFTPPLIPHTSSLPGSSVLHPSPSLLIPPHPSPVLRFFDPIDPLSYYYYNPIRGGVKEGIGNVLLTKS